jgi:hypothetical protein
MSANSTTDDQFSWRQQPALNLHQYIAWVMLRDALAVERIGDTTGLDAPKEGESIRCSERDPWRRHLIFGEEVWRVGDQRRLELVDAIVEIMLHLASGQMPSTALRVGPDGVPCGNRLSLDAIQWQSMQLNLITGGARDAAADVDLADLRFLTALALKLHPPAGSAPSPSPVEPPASRKRSPKNLDVVVGILDALQSDGTDYRGMNRGALLKLISPSVTQKLGKNVSERTLDRALEAIRARAG